MTTHPFLQWRRGSDGSRELLIGPSFGRTVIVLSLIVAGAMLLVFGYVKWQDLAPRVPSIAKFIMWRGA